MLPKLEHVLVVEDDDALRGAIVQVVRRWGAEISEARTAAEAKARLSASPPADLVLLDVRLPDESAFGVLDVAAGLSPTPLIVAISGKASPDEAFELAQRGVRAYLPKPFSIRALESALVRAAETAPSLEPVITARVGQTPMRQVQREVRRVMVKEALAKTGGSRSGAARLLQVTRQAVQQIIRSDASFSKSRPRDRDPAV